MKIQWKFQDEPDDGTLDLTGDFNGKHVDVVHRTHKDTWTIYVDNKEIANGIATRDKAKAIVTQYLETPNAPQKSFTIELTEVEGRGWAYSVNCPIGLCGIGYGVDPVDAGKMAVSQLNKSIKYMAKQAQNETTN